MALLLTTLLGVGISMFGPHPLSTHLAWLAAVILVGVFVSTALLAPRWSIEQQAWQTASR